MHPSLNAVADLYTLNDGIMTRLLSQVTEENEFTRGKETGNSANWLLGHMVGSRMSLAKIIGLEVNFPSGKLYSRSVEIAESNAYPSIAELQNAWNDITQKIHERFENLTEAELGEKPSFTLPPLQESVLGTVSFFIFHETYHLGQLAYVNRLNGSDRAFG